MAPDTIRSEVHKHESTAAQWAARARAARVRGQHSAANTFFAQAAKADERAHTAARRLVAAVGSERSLVAA